MGGMMDTIAGALLRGPFKGYFGQVTGVLRRPPKSLSGAELQSNKQAMRILRLNGMRQLDPQTTVQRLKMPSLFPFMALLTAVRKK